MRVLTIEAARARLQEISDVSHDIGRAHALEDDLWSDALETIAAGCDRAHAIELARVVLESGAIEFRRACA
jgi:hypothetical protein